MLGWLRADEAGHKFDEFATPHTKLSVNKISTLFKEFGFGDEADMVTSFLKSVGTFENGDYVFTP